MWRLMLQKDSDYPNGPVTVYKISNAEANRIRLANAQKTFRRGAEMVVTVAEPEVAGKLDCTHPNKREHTVMDRDGRGGARVVLEYWCPDCESVVKASDMAAPVTIPPDFGLLDMARWWFKHYPSDIFIEGPVAEIRRQFACLMRERHENRKRSLRR